MDYPELKGRKDVIIVKDNYDLQRLLGISRSGSYIMPYDLHTIRPEVRDWFINYLKCGDFKEYRREAMWLNTKGLTESEEKVLRASRETDYGDCLIEGQWSFAVCDAAKMNEKQYRGVVSSLVQKGYITIWDNEDKGRFRDMVFSYTESGRKLWVV